MASTPVREPFKAWTPWNAEALDDTTTKRVRINADEWKSMSMQAFWTGTPAGALTLWSSDKPDPSVSDDSDWDVMTEDPADPAGSASKATTVIADLKHRWVMLKYVPSTGSGTITTYVTMKAG